LNFRYLVNFSVFYLHFVSDMPFCSAAQENTPAKAIPAPMFFLQKNV